MKHIFRMKHLILKSPFHYVKITNRRVAKLEANRLKGEAERLKGLKEEAERGREQAERVAEVLRNQLRTAVEKATNLEETLMRQAGGPGGDLAALVEKAMASKAAPIEEESRAMHDKFAASTFTLVYTTLATFFGGLAQIIGAPHPTPLEIIAKLGKKTLSLTRPLFDGPP